MVSTNWVYTLIRALDELGGEAHVSQIQKCQLVEREQNLQVDLAASIRGSIHDYCSDHSSGKQKGARDGNARDVFEKTAPATWCIRSYENPFVQFALGDIDADRVRTKLAEVGEDESKLKQLLGKLEDDKEVFVREHWRNKPSPNLWKNQAFSIAHADEGKFQGAGLRAFFEYRQLGIKEATQGKFGAHVIRAVPGVKSPGEWHTHELDFQMVYVTKGWVVFEYDGQGEHMLREGSCVLQPPGIKHRELCHSDDMELIEIISPAEFETHPVDAPG